MRLRISDFGLRIAFCTGSLFLANAIASAQTAIESAKGNLETLARSATGPSLNIQSASADDENPADFWDFGLEEQAAPRTLAQVAGPSSTITSAWEAALFYIVGGTAALTALGCVLSTNIVRMATCLFGTLGAVAILYFLMAANFLGAIQLIVYAGGTLIVIIFGVMLTSKSPWIKYNPKPLELVAGGAVCGALFAGLTALLLRANWGQMQPNPDGFEVAHIGWSLLTTYLVPFELASVLLLAVMIGAAYLARPERGE